MHSPLPGQVRIILKLPQSISTLTGELAYLDLLRSLNGLRDASLHWLQLLSSTITHLGLWADEYEPCCYQGHVYDGDVVLGTVILVVYVDDILMCSSSRSAEGESCAGHLSGGTNKDYRLCVAGWSRWWTAPVHRKNC